MNLIWFLFQPNIDWFILQIKWSPIDTAPFILYLSISSANNHSLTTLSAFIASKIKISMTQLLLESD